MAASSGSRLANPAGRQAEYREVALNRFLELVDRNEDPARLMMEFHILELVWKQEDPRGWDTVSRRLESKTDKVIRVLTPLTVEAYFASMSQVDNEDEEELPFDFVSPARTR